MGKNKKRTKLKKIKLYYVILSVIFLLVLSTTFYVFRKNNNHIHYSKNTIIDASYHLKFDERYKKDTKLREQLNREIDKKFWDGCKNKTVFSLNIRMPCNFDEFYHYIESKTLLNNLDDNTRQMLVRIYKNSYEIYKGRYVKDFSSVDDNKLTHILLSGKLLNELNESEQKFWIMQVSRIKFNESQPLFPQTWNKVWLFWRLGFKNYKDLIPYGIENASQVCAHEISLQDALSQNIFREANATMANKYAIIKNFCSQK